MELDKTLKVVNVTIQNALNTIDLHCEGYRPFQLILYTLITTLVILKSWFFLFKKDEPLAKRSKKFVFRWIRRMPIVGNMIKKEVGKVKDHISAEKLFKLKPGMRYLRQLPREGYSDSKIIHEVDEYLSMDHKWDNGSVSGAIYNGSPELTNIVGQVCSKFTWTNPLHPDVFPGLRKMEAEVARMVCDMFHGDPLESSGTVTSGGTESILLAVKAYRDWALDNGIEHPEIVCPVSAHAAFEKAAHYFKVKIVQVPLDTKTWKVDINKMKKAITKNTCMIMGSAPQFPHGIIDPIKDIAALGLKYGIPVHVDACLGGFLIAFMEEAGFPLEPFDFRVPGVTSISADSHKYGYAPKGTSCILYSSPKWRTYQYFVSPDWQGGMYATPTLSGSRTGTVISGCWAVMVKFGRIGYVDCTRKVIKTARYITKELSMLENIFIFGEPKVCVVAMGSLDFDIFRLSSAMTELGWNLNSVQFPSAIHLCCTMLHTKPGVADRFVKDVKQSVQNIMMNPKKKNTGASAMYGMAQTIPDRSLVSELTGAYLDAMYDTSDYRNNGDSHRNGHI
ncbi:sphingosine-1-phosphate lyase 1-like [Styela clava]|uniref:sphingosine-1-phosphate lyase 1-like n=1 Tax=Styela clava TaxID=7725 RepID=UPI0019394C25|nr:sphingosine-1-phosphate lyase 1-like [Styela clava]